MGMVLDRHILFKACLLIVTVTLSYKFGTRNTMFMLRFKTTSHVLPHFEILLF
jgi:hypothetical protein